MTARRTSGSVGFGGAVGVGCFFPPRRCAEPQVLEVGEGDAAHQRMPMQPGPRSPLKGAEPKFLFELLVCLFADPACLDGCRKPVQRHLGRQIAQIIFPFAAAAPLADQPDLFAGQMTVTGTTRSIRDPHAYGCEPGREWTFAALSPGDAPPTAASQHVGRSLRGFAGHSVLTWFSPARTREQQPDTSGEHGLRAWDPDRPDQAARAQALPERRAETVTCIGQDT